MLGNNTVTCIQSGVIFGTAASIEGMVRRIQREVNEPFRIILTGGLSKFMQEHIEIPMERDSRLVLKGLLHIFHKNEK